MTYLQKGCRAYAKVFFFLFILYKRMMNKIEFKGEMLQNIIDKDVREEEEDTTK